MKRGLFIAFEGIDGCGKSTQVRMLANHILDLNKHNHITLTRNPYRNTDIRKILMAEDDPYSQAEKLAKLFVEDRKEQTKKIIAPNIKAGVHVISDRYALSTLAYQQTQGVPLKELLELHRGLPIPDIIFIVDVPADIALSRMKTDSIRKTEQKFEKNREFIEKLRKNYLDLSNLTNHNIVVIDGTKSKEDILEKQIKPAFDKFYNSSLSKKSN